MQRERALRMDGCDGYQFEDWFYCEHHAQKLSTMNRFLAAVVSA